MWLRKIRPPTALVEKQGPWLHTVTQKGGATSRFIVVAGLASIAMTGLLWRLLVVLTLPKTTHKPSNSLLVIIPFLGEVSHQLPARPCRKCIVAQEDYIGNATPLRGQGL